MGDGGMGGNGGGGGHGCVNPEEIILKHFNLAGTSF
jgi:hypothetical protein